MQNDLVELPISDEYFVVVHWHSVLATLVVFACVAIVIVLWLRRRKRIDRLGS